MAEDSVVSRILRRMDDQKRETTYPNLSGAVLPKRGGIELETRKIPSVLSGFLLVSPIFVFMTLSGHVLSPTAHAGSAIHTQAPVVVASKPGRPFATTTVRIPGLAYKQTMRGAYDANPGVTIWFDITVNYLPEGNGPRIFVSNALRASSMESFRAAVSAAAQAVGYPAEYIEAALLIQRAPQGAIDGPSAGGILAVSVAAALLGDTLRPDVCMTGTITPDLAIGPVGRVTDKIVGCAEVKAKEMVVPRGLASFELTTKSLSYNITVTEVSTLAEAYEWVTGKPLRSVN